MHRFNFSQSVWIKTNYNNISRGRAVVARRAHNPKVGGSSPPLATSYFNFYLYLIHLIIIIDMVRRWMYSVAVTKKGFNQKMKPFLFERWCEGEGTCTFIRNPLQHCILLICGLTGHWIGHYQNQTKNFISYGCKINKNKM